MKKKSLIIWGMLLFTTTLAQNISGSFQLRANDLVKKQQVWPIAIDETGQNMIWDLSDMELPDEDYVVEYSGVTSRDSIIAGTEHNTRYYYSSDSNTLQLWGYENNLTHVDYDHPEQHLQTPLVYGDKREGLFHGTATYCERLFMRLFGSCSVEVDGTGTLILPSGDTLRHVSRVHIRKLSAEQIYPDINTTKGLKAYIDSISPYNADSIRQYLQDGSPLSETNTYRWYTAGYRYPILEAVTIGMSGCNQQYATAFYCDPEGQEQMLDDDENEQLRRTLAEIDRQVANRQADETDSNNAPVENVNITVSGSTVTVSYDLTQDAAVHTLVCDIAGVVYRQKSQTGQAGDNCLMTISCDGLHHGQYVLYLNVNGHVTSTNISL